MCENVKNIRFNRLLKPRVSLDQRENQGLFQETISPMDDKRYDSEFNKIYPAGRRVASQVDSFHRRSVIEQSN